MATAILNVETYPFTLTIKDDRESVLSTHNVVPRPTESIDTTVGRIVRKHGFFTAGEPFDYDNASGSGTVYRLRAGRG